MSGLGPIQSSRSKMLQKMRYGNVGNAGPLPSFSYSYSSKFFCAMTKCLSLQNNSSISLWPGQLTSQRHFWLQTEHNQNDSLRNTISSLLLQICSKCHTEGPNCAFTIAGCTESWKKLGVWNVSTGCGRQSSVCRQDQADAILSSWHVKIIDL